MMLPLAARHLGGHAKEAHSKRKPEEIRNPIRAQRKAKKMTPKHKEMKAH
jgi:hypothetical protein